MKNLALLLVIVLTGFAACKKSSSDTPTPTGNYIKIDNDSRQLGDVPSADIIVSQNEFSNGVQLIMAMGKKIENIDDSKNQHIIITMDLYDGDTNTEYTIVSMNNPPPSSASIAVTLHGGEINAQMAGRSGKLYATRDSNNKITSFKFDNILMTGAYEATVSANIVIN